VAIILIEHQNGTLIVSCITQFDRSVFTFRECFDLNVLSTKRIQIETPGGQHVKGYGCVRT